MDDVKSLVHRAQTRDLEAYGQLVRSFQDMAYGYAYAILGDFHLAQDVAQEAFVEAHRCLASLRNPEAFPGWLRRIVFKHCDRLLRRKRLPTVPLETAENMASRDSSPARQAEERELRDAVLSAVQALPEAQRAVTTLYYINGYSQKEVAAFLELPVATVNNRLHSARMNLKERMVAMVKEAMGENRPSRDHAFAAKVVAALAAAGHGQAHQLNALLTESPELADAEGAHPYGWGYDTGPLHMSVQWGQLDEIAVLLDHGADIEAADGTDMKPLHLALMFRQQRAARLLVERGAAVDVWAAAALGDARRMKALLDEAPGLANSRDGHRKTGLLHWAGTKEVARILLDRGADPTALDAHGNSPARWAAGYCAVRPGVAEFLMAETGEGDVFMDCALGRLDAVRERLDADPDLVRAHIGPEDAVCAAFFQLRQHTPLHVAAFHGRADVAALLLERGADVASAPCSGFRALHAAAAFGNVETVQVLLDAGADPNARDDAHHGTPRAWAEFWRNPATLEFLTTLEGEGACCPGKWDR